MAAFRSPLPEFKDSVFAFLAAFASTASFFFLASNLASFFFAFFRPIPFFLESFFLESFFLDSFFLDSFLDSFFLDSFLAAFGRLPARAFTAFFSALVSPEDFGVGSLGAFGTCRPLG